MTCDCMRKKNPFYWNTKKMHSTDRESAWMDTLAMRRIGRKRFDELFRTEFNGKIVLIIPRDLSKVTLADLAVMWDDNIRFSPNGLLKNGKRMWIVGGWIEPEWMKKVWKTSNKARRM